MISELLSKVIEKSPDWVLITDGDGRIIYVNNAVELISKYAKSELLGKKPSIFKSNYHNRAFYSELYENISKGKPFESLFVDRAKDGALFYLNETIVPFIQSGKVSYILATAKNITRDLDLERKIYEAKYIDNLTGLLNKQGFSENVQSLIEKFGESECFHGALLFIDIVDFNLVNVHFGADFGDLVLKKLSKVLRKLLFKRDIVSRWENDRFAVFLPCINKENLPIIMGKLLNDLKLSMPMDEHPACLSFNIGCSVFPDNGKSLGSLITKASIALKISKSHGPNGFLIFSKGMDSFVKEKVKARDLVIDAFKNDYFKFFLQPVIDVATLKPVSFELLLRIKHPKRGLILPGVFLDDIVDLGLMNRITLLAVKNLFKYSEIIGNRFPISFNLSECNLRDKNFMKTLVKLFKKHSRFPFTIEITEKLEIRHWLSVRKFLFSLKERGANIAIDDFGTGYSGYSYLTEMPIDILKVDISLVRNADRDFKRLAMLKSIVDLAHTFGMKVVMEGVERQSEFEAIRDINCDMIQGFYFYKAMPIDDIEKLLLN